MSKWIRALRIVAIAAVIVLVGDLVLSILVMAQQPTNEGIGERFLQPGYLWKIFGSYVLPCLGFAGLAISVAVALYLRFSNRRIPDDSNGR